FSSRRRHTRFSRDWSSDVCSSDLSARERGEGGLRFAGEAVEQAEVIMRLIEAGIGGDGPGEALPCIFELPPCEVHAAEVDHGMRSEERRVGKECGSRWSQYDGRTR